MEGFEQNLHIADSAFERMQRDADRVLQKLLKNMVEKGSIEGSVTIKIDISLKQELIQNTDPYIEGKTRKVLSPAFMHKVGSMMQIKDEAKGGINYEGMEMVWDNELKEFVVKPIANTTQRTIFDADFQCVNDPEGGCGEEGEPLALGGRRIVALPGPSIGESEESKEEVVEAVPGSDTEAVEEAEDMSNAFDGMNPPKDDIAPENLPFGGNYEDDGYGYEEPGEEF